LHRRKTQDSHRALDEVRGGVCMRSRVETITPQLTPPQRTGGSSQFSHPGWHTLETTLGVRRNSSWALRSLLPALLAQFLGSRRTLRRKPALGAHCRRGANSWPTKQSLRAGVGASRPHWLRNFWLPSIHNPLLRPFSPRHHHVDISGPLQGALKVLIYVCYDLNDAEFTPMAAIGVNNFLKELPDNHRPRPPH
jgi:hypothetical protein